MTMVAPSRRQQAARTPASDHDKANTTRPASLSCRHDRLRNALVIGAATRIPAHL